MGNSADSKRKNFAPVKVDPSFEIVNGLVGMMRDILLKLCHFVEMKFGSCIGNTDQNIRNMFGICQEHHTWKAHSHFRKDRIRFSCIPTHFKPNPFGKCIVSRTAGMDQCYFCSEGGTQTIFLSLPITENVFRWTVQVRYGKKDRFLRIGAAPPNRLRECNASWLGQLPGTCCFRFGADLNVKLQGVKNYGKVALYETLVPDGSLVCLEANFQPPHTLALFVNGRRIPHAISHVPAQLYVGMSGCDAWATCVSFRRVAAASSTHTPASSIPYELYRCRT